MWVKAIDIWVPGIPAPGGSKVAFRHATTGKIVVKDDAKRNRSWRDRVAAFVLDEWSGRPPLTGPLKLSVTFCVPRPKGHYGTGRRSGVLKPSAPKHPTTRPDRTKLLRALEDALTGILYADDAQIVGGEIEKCYAYPGARIQLFRMEANECDEPDCHC